MSDKGAAMPPEVREGKAWAAPPRGKPRRRQMSGGPPCRMVCAHVDGDDGLASDAWPRLLHLSKDRCVGILRNVGEHHLRAQVRATSAVEARGIGVVIDRVAWPDPKATSARWRPAVLSWGEGMGDPTNEANLVRRPRPVARGDPAGTQTDMTALLLAGRARAGEGYGWSLDPFVIKFPLSRFVQDAGKETRDRGSGGMRRLRYICGRAVSKKQQGQALPASCAVKGPPSLLRGA
jgi:hypothetical protein